MSRNSHPHLWYEIHCLEAITRMGGNEAQKYIAVNHVESYLELSQPELQEFNQLVEKQNHMEAQAVGGDNSAQNLWPLPNSLAREKAVVEQRVHELLAAGTITQAQAVRAILRWVAEH